MKDNLLDTSLRRGALKFKYRVVFSIMLLLSVLISPHWLLSTFLILIALVLVTLELPRTFILQPKLLQPIISSADENCSYNWVKNGKIDHSHDENIIEGYSKIKENHFVSGVKFNERGVFIQFISVKMFSVVFYKWSSFDVIKFVDLTHRSTIQESAYFKLKDSEIEFVLPWNPSFDYEQKRSF